MSGAECRSGVGLVMCTLIWAHDSMLRRSGNDSLVCSAIADSPFFSVPQQLLSRPVVDDLNFVQMGLKDLNKLRMLRVRQVKFAILLALERNKEAMREAIR